MGREAYKSTQPKPFVFVLMPFSAEFDDLYFGIKQACENCGAYAERVDEQLFESSIMDRVYNQIAKADVIIADMTGRNPNVFYETGYAHALGKRVILLTQSLEDIPYDLTQYPHVVHGRSVKNLVEELEPRVRWAIEHPEVSRAQLQSDVQVLFRGITLADSPTIKYYATSDRMAQHEIQIDVHNLGENTLGTLQFRIGLVANRAQVGLDVAGLEISKTLLGDGRYLCTPRKTYELFPGGYESVKFRFYGRESFEEGAVLSFLVRISSNLGRFDFPFSLELRGIEVGVPTDDED